MKMFRRHARHSYRGYQFPWFLTILWLSFFMAAVLYLVRFVLLTESAG